MMMMMMMMIIIIIIIMFSYINTLTFNDACRQNVQKFSIYIAV
jgi:hypothetical protein